MAQVINTNVLSLNAQRNLSSSQSALSQSLQRLSSGLRINSAKDDAAGLAISERFSTQIRGLNQAIRNANDGISLSQTGEAALSTVSDNLQRIRELAVQSVNATNSNSDRAALDREVQERLEEIQRIANQTSFNGRNVLDGSFGTAKFQIGANVGQTIDLSLNTSVRTSEIGAVASATSVDLSTLIVEQGDDVPGTQAVATSATIGSGALVFDAQDPSVSPAIGAFTTIENGSGSGAATFTFTLEGPAGENPGDNTVTISETIAEDGELDAAGIASALNTALTNDTFSNNGFAVIDANGDPVVTIDASNLSTLRFQREDGQEFTISQSVDDGDTTGTGFATLNAFGDEFTVAEVPAGQTFTVQAPGFSATTITLASDFYDAASNDTADGLALLAEAINSQANGRFEVTVGEDETLVFTANSPIGSEGDNGGAFVFDGDVPTFLSAPTPTATGSNGQLSVDVGTPLELSTGDLTITIGDSEAIEIVSPATGFETQQQFVDEINRALAGNGEARLTNNTLVITAGQDITIAGERADDLFGENLIAEATGSLADINILTEDSSNDAIRAIDSALTAVATLRSDFGAIQNRFESTIANLSATNENLSAARSRIQDADFAQETAELTRLQILQQAGISVLAQANAAPQSVLALLQ